MTASLEGSKRGILTVGGFVRRETAAVQPMEVMVVVCVVADIRVVARQP